MADKHHYLSETYLNGFTSPGTGKLWAKRADGPVFTGSPNKLARRDGYDTVPQHWIARPPSEIEDQFCKAERAVAGFLRRAERKDADFSVDERHALVAFAAIHYARVPAAREHHGARYLHLLEASAAVMNSRSGSQYPTSGYTVAQNTDLGLMLQAVSAAIEVFDALHVKVTYFCRRSAQPARSRRQPRVLIGNAAWRAEVVPKTAPSRHRLRPGLHRRWRGLHRQKNEPSGESDTSLGGKASPRTVSHCPCPPRGRPRSVGPVPGSPRG